MLLNVCVCVREREREREMRTKTNVWRKEENLRSIIQQYIKT